jgi:uncharacterized protein YkwD
MSLFRSLLALAVAALVIALGAPASTTASIVPSRPQTEGGFVQALLLEINTIRGAHSLHLLRTSPALRRAAENHDREMARLGYFSHDSADGTDFAGRLERFYPSGRTRFWSVGENLLWSAANLTPKSAVRVWMHSAPHRANLLRPDWREIGIAAYRIPSAPGYFGHRRVWLLTTDFGVRY